MLATEQGIVVALIAFLLTPAMGGGRMSGSVHDFTTKGWNTKSNLCLVCHAECTAEVRGAVPLWSRNTTIRVFTPYCSASLKAQVDQPTGATLVCLSCHDGTIAIDAFNGRAGDLFIRDRSKLIDLRRSHPVSFEYDTMLAKRKTGLHDPDTRTVPVCGGKTIKQALLSKGRVECTACHDIHMLRGDSAHRRYFLVISMDRDALCRTCHSR